MPPRMPSVMHRDRDITYAAGKGSSSLVSAALEAAKALLVTA